MSLTLLVMLGVALALLFGLHPFRGPVAIPDFRSVEENAPQVLPDTFDNNNGLALIRQLPDTYSQVDENVTVATYDLESLMAKKEKWEKLFPQKEIVGLTILTDSRDASVVKLLISYKQ